MKAGFFIGNWIDKPRRVHKMNKQIFEKHFRCQFCFSSSLLRNLYSVGVSNPLKTRVKKKNKKHWSNSD